MTASAAGTTAGTTAHKTFSLRSYVQERRTAGPSASSGLLSSLAASVNPMRLSLEKAAYVVVISAA